MADGIVLDVGTGGSTLATDDAGVTGHVQIVKLALSADASAAPITADANGLEIQGAGTAGTAAGGVVTVQGAATGTAVPVSAASLPLPAGAATSANQTTEITALQIIDNTVAVFGTATYTEAISEGSVIGAVRRDADTTLVDLTNEIAPLQVDARGFLKVEAFSGETLPVSAASLPLPAGAATSAGQLAAGHAVDTELMAAAALADAASATPTTSSVGAVPLLMNATTLDRARAVVNALDSVGTGIAAAGLVGQLDDTATGAVTENQFAPVRISTRRALLVEGVASGTVVPVSGTVTATQTTAASLKAEVVGPTADNAANPTAKVSTLVGVALAAAPTRTEGNVNPLRLNLAGDVAVTLDSEAVVLGTGAATIGALTANQSVNVAQIAGTATVTGGVAGLQAVAGNVAHDAAVTANPLGIGAQMESMGDSAPLTRAGTDGDAVKLATTDGALYVIPTGPQTWSYHENSSSALTDTTVHAAPGAGLSLYITDVKFSTNAATAFSLLIEEGTTTTVLGPWYLEAVAGRGASINFSTPKKITANTLISVTTTGAIAHSIDILGFIAPG